MTISVLTFLLLLPATSTWAVHGWEVICSLSFLYYSCLKCWSLQFSWFTVLYFLEGQHPVKRGDSSLFSEFACEQGKEMHIHHEHSSWSEEDTKSLRGNDCFTTRSSCISNRSAPGLEMSPCSCCLILLHSSFGNKTDSLKGYSQNHTAC